MRKLSVRLSIILTFVLTLFFFSGCILPNKIELSDNIYDISLVKLWNEIESKYEITNEHKAIVNSFHLRYGKKGKIYKFDFDFCLDKTNQFYVAHFENNTLTIVKKHSSIISDKEATSIEDLFSKLDKVTFKRLEQGYSLQDNEYFDYLYLGESTIDSNLKGYVVKNDKLINIRNIKKEDMEEDAGVIISTVMKPNSQGWEGTKQTYYIIIKR